MMPPLRVRSSLWRLAAAVVLVEVVVILFVGARSALAVQEERRSARLARATAAADVLSASLGRLELGARDEMWAASVGPLLEAVAEDLDVHVALVDAEERVVAEAGPARDDDSIRRALVRDGARVGALLVSPPVTGMSGAVWGVVAPIAFAGALLIGVTLAIFGALHANLRADIRQLTRRVEDLAYPVMGRGGSAREAPADHLRPLTEALEDADRRLTAEIRRLRATRAEQDAILRSMEEGVIALDREQRVLNINRFAESMLGVDAESARGRLLQEVARQSALNRFVADAFAGESVAMREFEFQGETRRVVRGAASALRDEDGEPAGLLLVLSDITQLRRLEGMRSDFAANVSHELRTPITNIVGYAENLLEDDLADPEQARRFIKVIAENASRLGAIVEDMLALTRLERPGSHASFETASSALLPVVESACAQLRKEAERKKIDLRVEVPEDAWAEINQPLVEQAVVNLVSNALKYSPSSSSVTVAAGPARLREQEGVRIAVIDEGPGIEARHLPRVFERFYRVDKGRSRDQGGTGLGLAIVKHIALLHKGEVGVESELGKGSTFFILLPAARERSGEGGGFAEDGTSLNAI